MTKRKAFSYIRMSTETQLQGHSLERQLTLTRDYAEEKGFHLIEDLQDIGLSAHDGTNVKKGKLGKFLQAVKEGEIENDCVLLVESLDRLSRRTPMQAFSQFSEILSYGIEIHTIFDRQIYTEESINQNPGQLFSSIGYMLRAYSESEEKSKRLKKKWQSKRAHLGDKILTRICPAWLKASDKGTGFEVIADRAKAVRKIFDLCINENMGTYSITKHLNKNLEIYPTFASSRKRSSLKSDAQKAGWQKSYITKILNNPAVIGEFHPHEMIDGIRTPTQDVIKNYFPAVVSEKEFLLAQSCLKRRSVGGGGRKGDGFSNIFTKLLICGNCQGAVHFINKGQPPKGGNYLQCYNSMSENKCACCSWSYRDFEESFFQFCLEVNFENIFTKKSQKSRKAALVEDRQATLQKVERLNNQLSKTADLISGLTANAKTRIQSRIEEVSDALSIAEEELRKVELSLQELDSQIPSEAQNKILGYVKSRNNNGTHEGDCAIRRRLNKSLSSLIEKIELFNTKGSFQPLEADERISFQVRRELAKNGIRSEAQLAELFSIANGRKVFDEMERFFIVHFKNGNQKIVHPFIHHSITHRSNRNLKLIRALKSSALE